MNRAIVISVLVTIGVLATYVSGSILLTSGVTPGGTFSWTYGFPLPWITTVGVYCGSTLSSVGMDLTPCVKSATSSYDWITFAGDVLFYFGIQFGFILVIRKTWNDAIRRAKKQVEQLQKDELPEKLEPIRKEDRLG